MTTSTKFNSTTITASGRILLRDDSIPTVNESFDVALKGTLGGGTLSLQVSFEETPVLATDAHWITINGANALAVDRVYSVEVLKYKAIAVCLAGATTPSLTAIWPK